MGCPLSASDKCETSRTRGRDGDTVVPIPALFHHFMGRGGSLVGHSGMTQTTRTGRTGVTSQEPSLSASSRTTCPPEAARSLIGDVQELVGEEARHGRQGRSSAEGKLPPPLDALTMAATVVTRFRRRATPSRMSRGSDELTVSVAEEDSDG